eukprot:scaffold171759_cov54-Attheya_sp.AAC.2
MIEIPTSPISSDTLSFLVAVSSTEESPNDLEELLMPASLTSTKLLTTKIEVAAVIVPTKTNSLTDATLADAVVTVGDTHSMRKTLKVGGSCIGGVLSFHGFQSCCAKSLPKLAQRESLLEVSRRFWGESPCVVLAPRCACVLVRLYIVTHNLQYST